MERGMQGNLHVPCGAGEKPEITSNAYLLLTFLEQGKALIFIIEPLKLKNFSLSVK
jgi:hypothetical protein